MNPFGSESGNLTPVLGDRPSHARILDVMGMTAVVASPAMRRVLEKAEKVARTDSTVLITGESGVGKELIARAIHQFSPRRDKPFVDLNCAAFPEHLIESELFGYEKGAFSGADSMKQGLLEAGSGGTVFLDEIGELDPRMQPKLLRVLDGHPYYRLGGTKKIQNTARIVAATNASLEEAVYKGHFRTDLFHRLDAIQLRVPSLRERVEDIRPLCELFLRGSGLTFRDDVLAAFERYAWPGNIRELRNVLNKAVVFTDGNEITLADLPAEMLGASRRDAEDAAAGYSLERIEEETILRALDQTGWHQQKAADILGISRRTLIRKLKTYGLPRAAARAGHSASAHSPGHRRGPGFGL